MCQKLRIFFIIYNFSIKSSFFFHIIIIIIYYFRFINFYLVSSLRDVDCASPKLVMSRGFHTGDPTIKKEKNGKFGQIRIYNHNNNEMK